MKSDLKYNYHDGWLAGSTIGPRREVTLRIMLDSVWNDDKELAVDIRFGGIENYDVVAEYCEILAKECKEDGGVGSRIDALDYNSEKLSTQNSHWLNLQADGWGLIDIHCRSVKETDIEK